MRKTQLSSDESTSSSWQSQQNMGGVPLDRKQKHLFSKWNIGEKEHQTYLYDIFYFPISKKKCVNIDIKELEFSDPIY